MLGAAQSEQRNHVMGSLIEMQGCSRSSSQAPNTAQSNAPLITSKLLAVATTPGN